MSKETSQEIATKYLKQVFVAVAVLLVLYGIVQLLNLLTDLTNVNIGYQWWFLFQIIAAIIIIFIGLRIFSLARTIKMVNLVKLRREARPQLLALLLGCLTLIPFVLYPLPVSSSLSPQLFQPYSVHRPISFSYKLDYRWNLQTGGSILMYTSKVYPYMNFAILVDIVTMNGRGWIVIPYEIYAPEVRLPAFGPARAEIKLGMIENGSYILKVVMSDTIDLFEVHKTNNRFWLEEVNAKKGVVVQKNEFDKRLDGFKVEFIGFPNIDNETKDFVRESIHEIGGVIIDIKSYFEGWSVEWYFYYDGGLSMLRQIIREISERHPEYMIGIRSNTGWYALTWVKDSYK